MPNRQQRRAGGGGAGGGFGGINPDMLRQAQELQAKMMQAQQEAAQAISEGSAGGGVVKAQVKGDLKLMSITIDRDAVDPDDVEMLQDLVVTAVREAQDKAEQAQQEVMGSLTGGLNIPGLLG